MVPISQCEPFSGSSDSYYTSRIATRASDKPLRAFPVRRRLLLAKRLMGQAGISRPFSSSFFLASTLVRTLTSSKQLAEGAGRDPDTPMAETFLSSSQRSRHSSYKYSPQQGLYCDHEFTARHIPVQPTRFQRFPSRVVTLAIYNQSAQRNNNSRPARPPKLPRHRSGTAT